MPEADKPLVWLHGEVQTPPFSPWRIIYRIDSDAVVIAEVFSKKTQATPRSVIEVCRRRLGHTTKPQKVGETDEQEQAGASGRSRLAIRFG
jgi:hypothetical protein